MLQFEVVHRTMRHMRDHYRALAAQLRLMHDCSTMALQRSDLSYETHGAQRIRSAANGVLGDICNALSELPEGRPGLRINGLSPLRPILSADGAIGGIAETMLGSNARAVRALLFDKTRQTNWALAWHQDRTICVQKRIDVEGFGPWSVKNGMHHVEPPFEYLARMLTVRVHLDDVPEDNAPLMVAPGSHRLGRVPEPQIDEVVHECGAEACVALAGDIWVYSTPILHASRSAAVPCRRRVLQIDYSADELPAGLQWLGV